MFEDKCVWSALYPISNHSHIRQLQFATHAFSQQVLQQAVQINICQWCQPTSGVAAMLKATKPEEINMAEYEIERLKAL